MRIMAKEDSRGGLDDELVGGDHGVRCGIALLETRREQQDQASGA